MPRGVFDEFKALLQWQKSGNTIDFTDLGLDPQVHPFPFPSGPP